MKLRATLAQQKRAEAKQQVQSDIAMAQEAQQEEEKKAHAFEPTGPDLGSLIAEREATVEALDTLKAVLREDQARLRNPLSTQERQVIASDLRSSLVQVRALSRRLDRLDNWIQHLAAQ